MGKLVLRKTILRNMIDRVWAALVLYGSLDCMMQWEKVWMKCVFKGKAVPVLN
jgi:hypothetical protein